MRAGVLLLVAAALAGGCAQTPAEKDESAAELRAAVDDEYGEGERVCERIRRTGTHRTTVICRTKAEIEQEAVDGKDTFDTLRNSQINSSEYGRPGGEGRQ